MQSLNKEIRIINMFDLMAENKPCPASQLSAGSFAAASLCPTIFHRVLANKERANIRFLSVGGVFVFVTFFARKST
ncbi:hypothetical protein [Legionella sp. WA2022007384]